MPLFLLHDLQNLIIFVVQKYVPTVSLRKQFDILVLSVEGMRHVSCFFFPNMIGTDIFVTSIKIEAIVPSWTSLNLSRADLHVTMRVKYS